MYVCEVTNAKQPTPPTMRKRGCVKCRKDIVEKGGNNMVPSQIPNSKR